MADDQVPRPKTNERLHQCLHEEGVEKPCKVGKKVSFKDDSENLMKPPCMKKVFDADEPATAISSDEEEPAPEKIIISNKAWRPKNARRKQVLHAPIEEAQLRILEHSKHKVTKREYTVRKQALQHTVRRRPVSPLTIFEPSKCSIQPVI